jgi:pyruvate/2-oxoglutarate/acetoin dehydrogenase E1 component
MRLWLEENGLATAEEIDALEKQALEAVKTAQKEAWAAFLNSIKAEISGFCEVINQLSAQGVATAEFAEMNAALQSAAEPLRRDLGAALHKALRLTAGVSEELRKPLLSYYHEFNRVNEDRYSSHLHSNSAQSALKVQEVPAVYTEETADGYMVVRACFDEAMARDPRVFAFGEDVGKIGDVNQGFSGLQEKYGELRVTDKGIREWSIVGEGIGAAMRGLRPIAEIQYLDYLLYALEVMSDDIATLQYRTKGGQKAPIIIRTRGHRLEGIWHSGSPMGAVINAVRGMFVCVPRNMTQAAGMYNTLLKGDDPALVVECLNGYRIKEKMPANIGEFTVPLGRPDILRYGEHATLVTYGSCCRIALEAADLLAQHDIRLEVIDVQTLLPFDLGHQIAESLKETNRLVVFDEDVPGGASAYILQEILEKQNGYRWLDSAPLTITAKAHRPAYGSDGDYFSKPGVDEVFMKVYGMMHEVNPEKWPALL